MEEYISWKRNEVKKIRKVNLNMEEQSEYEIIKSLVDHDGNKQRAAVKLNCSIRTINRKINGYKKHGKEFFIHGNKGRQPASTTPKETRDKIIDLYNTKYYDASFKHATELLKDLEDIAVSASLVRSILMGEDILSPYARKKTVKRVMKKLNAKKETAKTQKEAATIESQIVSIQEAHPRRPRCAYFGELIQMDASNHLWFGNVKSFLHVAVDDATGNIVGAYFDHQETLNAYYNVTHQILTEYGIPHKFLTDCRTVFEYKSKNSSEASEDTFTQFGYACKQLGIEIQATSVAQAKGRVERIFGTLQKRLPVLLRLAAVTSLEQANEFLNAYIKEFNAKFALAYDHTASVFEKQPSLEKINLTLAVLTSRKVDNGHSIRFQNKYLKTLDENNLPVHLYKGTQGMVVKAFDHSLYFCVGEIVYALEEIPSHERFSKNFDFEVQKSEPKKRYIPPMNHPWRKQVFDKFLKAQPHRIGLQDYA